MWLLMRGFSQIMLVGDAQEWISGTSLLSDDASDDERFLDQC